MATASITVILFYIIYLLQNTVQGQQCGLCNNLGLINGASGEPIIAGLISPVKPNSQSCKCSDTGSKSKRQQSTKPPLTGLQQFLSLQQPKSLTETVNPQSLNIQSLSGCQGSQQTINPQCLQQLLNEPQQQVVTFEQPTYLQLINAESSPSVFQSTNQQYLQSFYEPQVQSFSNSFSLQPVSYEQLMLQQQAGQTYESIPMNNYNIISQQSSNQNAIPLESLPIINGQIQGIPAQVSQNLLLSNLGLTSNLPTILPKAASKSAPEATLLIPLSNVGSNPDASISVSKVNENKNAVSSTVSPSSTENGSKNPTQLLLVPFNFQNSNQEVRNENQSFNLAQNPTNPAEYLQSSTQSDVKSQSTPQQAQIQQVQTYKSSSQNIQTNPVSSQMVQTYPGPSQHIQIYPTQNKNSETYPPYSNIQNYSPSSPNIQTYPVQSQTQTIQSRPIQQPPLAVTQQPTLPPNSLQEQTTSTQSLPVPVSSSQTIPTQPTQFQTAALDSTPIPFDGNSNPLASFLLSQIQNSGLSPQYFSNQGSKSSTMKTLLPLLFDLLKEKNGGCCNCPNCNCGYMNNIQDPQCPNPYLNNQFMQNYNSNIQPTQVSRIEQQESTGYNNDHTKKELKPHNSSDGYVNQIKYGQPVQKKVSQNVIESEEKRLPKKVQDRQKNKVKEQQQPQVYKNRKDDSAEYSMEEYYYDSYEYN